MTPTMLAVMSAAILGSKKKNIRQDFLSYRNRRIRAIKMGSGSQDIRMVQTFRIVNPVGGQPKKNGRTCKLIKRQ